MCVEGVELSGAPAPSTAYATAAVGRGEGAGDGRGDARDAHATAGLGTEVPWPAAHMGFPERGPPAQGVGCAGSV